MYSKFSPTKKLIFTTYLLIMLLILRLIFSYFNNSTLSLISSLNPCLVITLQNTSAFYFLYPVIFIVDIYSLICMLIGFTICYLSLATPSILPLAIHLATNFAVLCNVFFTTLPSLSSSFTYFITKI